MITANGCRRDWVAGNTPTLNLDFVLHCLFSDLESRHFGQTHLWCSEWVWPPPVNWQFVKPPPWTSKGEDDDCGNGDDDGDCDDDKDWNGGRDDDNGGGAHDDEGEGSDEGWSDDERDDSAIGKVEVMMMKGAEVARCQHFRRKTVKLTNKVWLNAPLLSLSPQFEAWVWQVGQWEVRDAAPLYHGEWSYVSMCVFVHQR